MMMKCVILSINILLLGVSYCKKVGDGHSGQKKQFVNFGDNEGFGGNSYSRNSFGSFGMFGGGGGGGGGGGLAGLEENDDQEGGFEGGGGNMQLNENNMGGISLQGNGGGGGGMDSLGAMLGASNQFAGMGGFIGANNAENEGGMFEGQSDQSMSALGGNFGQSLGQSLGQSDGGFSQSLGGRGESMFGSMEGSNDDNEDILSPFDANSLEGKLEHSINLGDNVNTPGIGQFDMSSFDDTLGGKNNDKMVSALQSELADNMKQHKQHKQGDDRQGIGNGNMQDMLSNELGELDTSDEKLQKMLESGLNGNSGFNGATGDNTNSGTDMSGLNALLNSQGQMDSMDTQPQSNQDSMDLNNIFGGGSQQTSQQQQQQALNQLSGTLSGSTTPGDYKPVTIHAHASDKPGSDNKDGPPPEESMQAAQQVQLTAVKQHKVKLNRLKSRLRLLREKLRNLEEEQSKKSSSNKNNDPKTARNDAIKKLLIKNLKLAAMIASKEIELEEAKGKGLAYLSGKKEDTEVIGESTHSKLESSNAFKPLTELSKKAEEEVNHLSRNPTETDKKINSSVASLKTITLNDHNNNNNNNKNMKNNSNTSNHTTGRNTFLRRINETLQVLDKASPEVHTRSTLTESSKRFLKKLEKQIQSMSLPQAHVVEEKALATLYKAIKAKAVKAAKRRFILKRLRSKNYVDTKS